MQYREPHAALSLERAEHGPLTVAMPEVATTGVIRIFLRHRWLFAAVFLFISAVGALYIFASHKKYASHMEILVQNGRAENGISAGRQEAPAAVQEVTEEELNSEAALLQSADVLDEVVDPNWHAIDPQKRPAAVLEKHEAAVGALRKALSVSVVRKSHLLAIDLTTRSPQTSTDELNALLDAFMREKRKISHPKGVAQMFAQQADTFKHQWDDAQRSLSQFQQTRGMVSVNDQEQLVEKQILDLDTQLRNTEVAVNELQNKLSGDKVQLASIPSRRPTRETAIPATGSIDQMNGKLSELTLQRTELLTKYKPDDRLVREVDQKIADIRSALKNSQSLYSAETSSDVNPTWQMAEQDLSETTARLAGVLGRRDALRKQVANLQQQLSSTESSTQNFNALQQRATELQANYQLYAQKRDEASMAEVMDEHQLLNVAVVESPTFSLAPVRPRPFIDGVLTLMTALFFASFAVFLAHNGRATVADESELRSISSLPTLATVPVHKALRGEEIA